MIASPWISGFAPNGAPFEPGTRWAVFASHIGDYMHRWIIRTPWGDLRVHRILRPDAAPDPHDHPFDFTSLIVRGGYVEELDQSPRPRLTLHAAGSVVRRKAGQAHRIILVAAGTTTLVLAGPKIRGWGFRTPKGWVPWRRYVADHHLP